METNNLIDNLKHEAVRKHVKFLWLAKLLTKIYLRIGEYLFKNGLISDVVDVDVLTGLYNRNFFERWSPKLVAQAKRSGVVISLINFDLNDLKKTNDTKGHEAGNKMLRKFARKVTKKIRESDLLCRIGGDEFVAVMWACDTEKAIVKIEKVVKILRKEKIYFSYGVVDSSSGLGLSEMISEADKLMYTMKREMKRK